MAKIPAPDKLLVSEEAVAEIIVYPNPVWDILNIALLGSEQPSIIKLYSANGRLIETIVEEESQHKIQINTSTYSKGIYIAQIITGKEMRSVKFVKQ